MILQNDDDEWIIREPKEVSSREIEFNDILDRYESDVDRMINSLQQFVQNRPDHVDAFHHLALYHYKAGNIFEAILLEKHAVETVLKASGGDFNLGDVRLSWEVFSNRPFLRALHGLGVFQFEYGQLPQAKVTLEQLISFNPSDNLGGRYILSKLAFETGDPTLVIATASNFPNDRLPDLIFGKALASIYLEQWDIAESTLIDAVSLHPKVADSLLNPLVEAVDLSNGRIMMGGEDQAFAYRQDYLKYWLSNPNAIPLLKSVLTER